MRTEQLRNGGTVVLIAVTIVSVVRTLSAPVEPTRALHGPERVQVARQLADAEPGFRRDSSREFPGDRWSQGDAYHLHEDTLVREIGRTRNAAVESVLDVLDQSLREQPSPERPAGAPPCKPRPTYD